MIATLGASLAGGTMALAGGGSGGSSSAKEYGGGEYGGGSGEGEYRPGKGCGDQNHTHTGPPGNPENDDCPDRAGGKVETKARRVREAASSAKKSNAP